MAGRGGLDETQPRMSMACSYGGLLAVWAVLCVIVKLRRKPRARITSVYSPRMADVSLSTCQRVMFPAATQGNEAQGGMLYVLHGIVACP